VFFKNLGLISNQLLIKMRGLANEHIRSFASIKEGIKSDKKE
jgi:hypothetical protein